MPETETFAPVPETRPETARILTDAFNYGLHTQLPEESWNLVSTYYSTGAYVKDLTSLAGTKFRTTIKKRILTGVGDLRSALIDELSGQHTETELDEMYPQAAVQIKKVIRGVAKHTPESKAKISKANKGRPLSEAHKRRLSELKTGVPFPHTAENNQRISQGLILFYQTHTRSVEWRQRISDGKIRSNQEKAAKAQSRLKTGEFLFVEYGDDVTRFINSFVRNLDVAEDIKQEVFIRAFLKYDPDKIPADKTKSWLFKVAKNETFRYFDKIKRRPQSASPIFTDDGEPVDYFDLISDPTTYTDETFFSTEEAADVNHALSSVFQTQRDALYLHYYQNYTPRDISRLTDTPIELVETRLRNGLHRLRPHLEHLRDLQIA